MRDRATALRRWARFALSLRHLPPTVAAFVWRAQRRAARAGDEFSLASAARPRELKVLLRLAAGRRSVVELGTGTAWSAIALVLADPARSVITYDPEVRPQREAYIEIAGARARQRITLRREEDVAGPHAGDARVELLFIDSAHDREGVTAAFTAWRGALDDGAAVVFHDYDHPDYPGVREAVEGLGLVGERRDGVFVWRPGAGVPAARGG